MRFTVSYKDTGVDARMQKLISQLPGETARALDKAAIKVMAEIKNDARLGIGLNGKHFKSYSAPYAQKRAEQSRQVSPPNLIWTGQMMAAMNVGRASQGGAKIYFSNVAAARKAFFNNRTRPFFGLDGDKREIVRREVARHFRSRGLI